MDYILHTLGLCGEQHINLLTIIAEWPIISNILSYLKNIIK
jgi:hypothetical protein